MAIVTLTTDFGTHDHYAGVMKGVILGISRSARIVDITHDVTPFETGSGAFRVSQTYPYFPKGTIHVVVVDPGVGTSRRAILVEAAGQKFVGPDNGVFSLLYAREKHKVRAVTADEYFRKPVSKTFHGRDVFAPVAAHLAAGVAPARFGKRIEDYVRFGVAPDQPNRMGRHIWMGTVLEVDRFGNLITNFAISEFEQLRTRPFAMQVGAKYVSRLVETYEQAPPGEPVLIAGSSGYVEVSVQQGSAAKALGVGPGAPVELTLR